LVDLSEIQAVYYMVAATGVLVAAVYYIYNMRISQRNSALALKTQQQTLETRQAQMFMNIYQQTATKEFSSAYNTFLSYEWKNFDEFRELCQKKEILDQFQILAMYWEGIGVLVREGFLPIRLVALLITGMTRSFWEKLNPIKVDMRVNLGWVRWMSETEYLYDELLRYIREHPELATELRNPLKPK